MTPLISIRHFAADWMQLCRSFLRREFHSALWRGSEPETVNNGCMAPDGLRRFPTAARGRYSRTPTV